MYRSIILLFVSLVFVSSSNSLAEDVNFNRDIRPILSDKCYFCHGPDAENREADLRFDTSEGSKEAIASGEFLSRIMSDDPDSIMPPPSSKLSLTKDEKAKLKAWVKAGSKYEGHWAFQSLPKNIPVPTVKNKNWSKVALDKFVLAKLEAEKITPSKEADALRWLRRVRFDLTGLPPTPKEIENFQSKLKLDKEKVYKDEVDRILALPSYGEHMAVGWLDAARYADSYGYQSDKLNTQWPYRDWVISAFNNNLPYDKFLTWQLAGDLLENPTREQRLATAFNRIHRLNNEGGAVYEEWRLENVSDRVHTFGTAVLGLTLECCRCHDHKYDPISARDYYSLSAFFNSIDENGLYDRTAKVPSPTMLLPTDEQQTKLQQAKERLEIAIAAEKKAVLESKKNFEKIDTHNVSKAFPKPRLTIDFDTPFNNEKKKVYHTSTGDRGWTTQFDLIPVENNPVSRVGEKDSPRNAILLDGERGFTTHGVTPFDRWTPFSVVITFKETKRVKHRAYIAHHTRGTDTGPNGWDLTINDGFVDSRMYRVWPGNAIGVRTVEPIPSNQWHQLAATYDGNSTANSLKLYLNGEPLETEVLRDSMVKSANVKVDHGGEFVIGQRFRDRGFDGTLLDDVRLFEDDLNQTQLKSLATGEPIIWNHEMYVSMIDENCIAAKKKRLEAMKEFVMAEEVMNEIPIMEELSKPIPAHILARGEYDAPKNEKTLVQRETFKEILPRFPDGATKDRLGLAKWTNLSDHPLTSRVFVNRVWANFFGRGLVNTPENFGLQGELPTHPELLDWLARDFVEHKWDVKRLCRQIVLSATYRQDSTTTPELLKRDPENHLLARGPAYRLGAEQIRDMALASSGLLNPMMGGQPVSPYQAGGDLWKESNSMSPAYKQSVGKSLYRRSIYSVWKRTSPLPNMMAFDTSSREVCTVERSRTNTPLQALVLMNDVQFVEACKVLAEKILLKDKGSNENISAAFLALAGRLPDANESNELQKLLAEEEVYYSKNKDEAEKLIAQGEKKTNSKIETHKLAALTNVCQVILNLDASIWKR